MFSDDSSIENFKQLFIELKRFLELQTDYLKLDAIEKLSKLFYIVVLAFLLSSLGMIALFYLMFTCAYLLNDWLNNLAGSFAIVSGLVVFIAFIIFIFRKPLIIEPMVRTLANIFLNNEKNK